jgi:WD40 repeat protein
VAAFTLVLGCAPLQPPRVASLSDPWTEGARDPDAPTLRLETGGHRGRVGTVRFSPDGRELYTAGDDKVVRVWNAERGTLERTLRLPVGPGTDGNLYALDVSPDGRRVAVAGCHGCEGFWRLPDAFLVHLLDAQSGEILGVGRGHTNAVRWLSFSPDGTALASSAADGTARVWGVGAGGMLVLDATLSGHSGPVNAVEWFPDGSRLATGADDGYVGLWERHPAGGWFLHQAFAVDGTPVNSVAWAPGSLVAGTLGGSVGLFDAASGAPRGTPLQAQGAIGEIALSPDGGFVACATGARGEDSYAVEILPLSGGPSRRFRRHDNTVHVVDWSRGDPALLASAGGHHAPVYVYGAADLEVRYRLQGPGRAVLTVGVAPGRVAWGQAEGTPTVTFLNERGPLEQVLDAAEIEWTRTARVPDGFERGDGVRSSLRVGIPRRETGAITVTGRLGGERDIVVSRAWIVTYAKLRGDLVAVGTEHGLWVVDARGRSLRRCTGHESQVWTVAPYDGGRLLVSGSLDHTLRFWNPETCELLLSFYPHPSGDWIAWTPQGFYKASTGGEALAGVHVNHGAAGTPSFHPLATRPDWRRPDVVEAVLAAGSVAQALAGPGGSHGAR